MDDKGRKLPRLGKYHDDSLFQVDTTSDVNDKSAAAQWSDLINPLSCTL